MGKGLMVRMIVVAVTVTLNLVGLTCVIGRAGQHVPGQVAAQNGNGPVRAFLPQAFRLAGIDELTPPPTAVPTATPSPTVTPTATATPTATITPTPTITPTNLPPLDPWDLPHPSPPGFRTVTGTSVSALALVPFDVDRQDLVGPGDHAAQYGKLPEIVVAPGAGRLDVALRSFDAPDHVRTLVLRFEDTGAGLTLRRAIEAPSLGHLLGLATTPDGGFFYATGSADPAVSATYPAVGQHRRNVVLIHRVGADGRVLYDVDLDHVRSLFAGGSEPIIAPGRASTARLAFTGNQLALVHGINTAPDPDIQNRRHQKALSTYLDATTGAITRAAGIWCSHSFDQRYLVDGDDIYELHLGDAYPRQVVVSRIRAGAAGPAIALYYPKGAAGENNTFTRLGGIARIDAGAAIGRYLTLIATERTTGTATSVSGSRDLALMRTVVDFASGPPANALDTTFGTTFSVVSAGATRSNRVKWLTSYHIDAPGQDHAERPKLVALGGGEFMVLWERWSIGPNGTTFQGTYAMRVDGAGAVLKSAARVADGHLPRGDDAFPYDGQACWLTGDSRAHTLTLHCVAPDLATTHTVLGPTWIPTPGPSPTRTPNPTLTPTRQPTRTPSLTPTPGPSPTPTRIPAPGPTPATRIDDTSPMLTRRGQWRTVSDDTASGGTYIVSTAANDELEMQFSGDHAAILRTVDPSGGDAIVTIDGVSYGTLSSQFIETRPQVPAVFDQLGAGSHALVLRALAPGFSFDVLEALSRYTASADQQEAEGRIHHYRELAGLPRARLHRAINLAAQAHADYDARFQEGHREAQGQAGFTGGAHSERMAYFGYTDSGWEAMLGGYSGPTAVVDAMMSMVFHRLAIMEPEGVDIGFGTAAGDAGGRSNVLDLGTRGYDYRSPRTLYTYPADGQTGVPTQWEGLEDPDPLPDQPRPVGYPVSLHIGSAFSVASRDPVGSLGLRAIRPGISAPAGDWDVQTATLTDAAGRLAPVYVLGPDSGEFVLWSPAVFIVAQRPLQPNTRYTAHVVGADDVGRRFERRWSFVTGTD